MTAAVVLVYVALWSRLTRGDVAVTGVLGRVAVACGAVEAWLLLAVPGWAGMVP